MSGPNVFLLDANIGAGAAVGAAVLLMTFWENIEKINNKHMRYSILAWALAYMVAQACVSTSFRAIAVGNVPLFVDRIIGATFFYDLSFSLLTYHSAYRTILICKPFAKNIAIAAAIVTATQMVVHGTASYYWASNMKNNFGGSSAISQKMEIIVLVYYSVIESVLFAITQYKIIESKSGTIAKKGKSTNLTKLSLYAKGGMRSLAYTINITLGFLALGNVQPVEFSTLEAWNFPMYGPIFCVIIILTDVSRFQSCIATITKSGAHKDPESGSAAMSSNNNQTNNSKTIKSISAA